MMPEIVLGPPGTGKTTTLLAMVEDALSRGVPPDRIGFVTFTRRAAQEAQERAIKKFSLDRQQLRWFRTLHSLCFAALGMSNTDVFEGRKVVEFGHWCGIDLSEMRFSDDGLMTGYTIGDRALFMENLARVRQIALRDQYEENHDGLPWNIVEHISRALSSYKKEHALLDYTDMLQHFADMEWSPDLEELYVDESQDLSLLQWRVVEKLARGCRRVVIAGDDDQAIYRWAGAAVEYFVEMQGDVTVLGLSHRCPPEIQAVSSEIIGRVSHRREKRWNPRDGQGAVVRARSFAEVDLSGPDILVLGRNAFVIRNIMDSVRSDGIIYEWRGHSSVSQPILEAVRAWEMLRRGDPVTTDEVRRIYEYMSSGVGVRRGYKQLPGVPPDQLVDMQWCREAGGLMRDEIWHEALDRIPLDERTYLLRARQKGERTGGRARVRLSTIHGAKGGEADHVVLLRDMASRTHAEMQGAPEDEARVWYVAVTRARHQITIVAPESQLSYDV